jgi:hypothetical protein
LKEQNFEKIFLQSLKRSYLSFLKEIFFSLLAGKTSFRIQYAEYTRNDRSFPPIGPMKNFVPENSNKA